MLRLTWQGRDWRAPRKLSIKFKKAGSARLNSCATGQENQRRQGRGITAAEPQPEKPGWPLPTTLGWICPQVPLPTLQNIKPASITPRGWLTFRPAGPKTAPGVELVA